MNNKDHLLAQRYHLREAIEGDRQRLAKMWDNGIRGGWLFNKLNERMKLSESKVDKINMQLCPNPKNYNLQLTY
jgi:hypothetical protein